MSDKKLARNVDAMMAAEMVKQQFDELVLADFTPAQAIEYLTSLIAKRGFYDSRNKKGDKNAKNSNTDHGARS